MNEIFEKIYNDNNTDLNESSALFEKVYTEAEMLNEMNPKLRALLAAGLIGTASLGAASCSMPTDDPYDPVTIEQPAPETPSNPAPENPDPDDPGDNNGGDTKEAVTFETLGVEDYAESLARAKKSKVNGIVREYIQIREDEDFKSLIYKNSVGFVFVEFDENYTYEDGQTYIRYRGDSNYYVPKTLESDFDAAIAAYNNAQ
jgi:hypothetical protein